MKEIAIILTDDLLSCNPLLWAFLYPRSHRCLQIADQLASVDNFFVTIYVPYFDPSHRGNLGGIKSHNYDVVEFNGKATLWNWSSELERLLRKANYIIMPISQGVAFYNALYRNKNVRLILDATYSFMHELAGMLLGTSMKFRQLYWNRYLSSYNDLLRSASCVIYGHDRQYYYLEGQMVSINKLNCGAFQFSPLLKIPWFHSFDSLSGNKRDRIQKLFWLGPIYAYSYPEKLIEIIGGMPDVQLDFIGVKHPTYHKAYTSYFKKYFLNLPSNITVKENFPENLDKTLLTYDACIHLSRGWIDDRYLIRNEVWYPLLLGIPVITNAENPIFLDFFGKENALYGVHLNTVERDLELCLKENNSKFASELYVSSDVTDIIKSRVLDNQSFSNLVDYINNA